MKNLTFHLQVEDDCDAQAVQYKILNAMEKIASQKRLKGKVKLISAGIGQI